MSATGQLFTVNLPTGTAMHVANDAEAAFVTERVARYTDEYRFTNVSDLAELDRIVVGETLAYRNSLFLLAGKNYEGRVIEPVSLAREEKERSAELRAVKQKLGIDKIARDKQRGEGSVHDYLQKLLIRAKQFGVHRETQLDRALELINELIGMVTFYNNASPAERKEFEMEADDIIKWIWDRLRPEYEEIDAHFREHQQRLWIREQ